MTQEIRNTMQILNLKDARIVNPVGIAKTFPNIEDFNIKLKLRGCKACSLGFQPEINGVCISRGNPKNRLMIVGECPGKVEDSTSKPFSGPAGVLLDKIWASIEWDTNDWYITNSCLCRPFMPKGSGRENYTPLKEQLEKCRPFLDRQIELIRPKVIVTLGRIATETVCGVIGITMGKYRGKSLYNMPKAQGAIVFPMWHPAYLLRNPNGPAKQQTWDDIRKLKQIVEEL